ncbi:hypothetical protein RIF29_17277 [Crotalaria pallida]|uniref:Uncharacterized protein n=1 Tax=Crotalaria pallida TaxID=3830 RepID=A0AAN9IF61_CROPI
MMMVRTSFFVLLSMHCLLSLHFSSAHQPSHSHDALVSARLLDSHLQNYAFKALSNPTTGVPYDAQVPTNLTGIKVSAMRLLSSSLRTRGVQSYKEFDIAIGVVEEPYVKRLVLVYHNLGNWSNIFYPLHGYSYLAPVLGLLAYNGDNLSASGLPELNIRVTDNKILVKFHDVEPAPFGSLPKCVYFDLHGAVKFENLLPGNVCSTVQQGHFSIVVESNNTVPSHAHNGGGGKKKMSWVSVFVPCLIGGLVLLIILGLVVARVRRNQQGKRIQQMESIAESSETLYIASIGGTKAPLAMGTRTRPMIETDFIL